ncbi:Hypothetical protein POVR2_LOCUS148 [uncultured virus]|nr:Hypothetical protein POVR2_LOCUS148 [uncultured virus]
MHYHPYVYDTQTVDDWSYGACAIAGLPYLVAIKKTTKPSGVNKVASAFARHELRGPVVFILLNHIYRPSHMDVSMFKALGMNWLVK